MRFSRSLIKFRVLKEMCPDTTVQGLVPLKHFTANTGLEAQERPEEGGQARSERMGFFGRGTLEAVPR